MVTPLTLGRAGPPVDRTGDRIVAAVSIGLSVAFLAAAALALLLPEATRHGLWLPVHLALAGAAATAIAGVLPFFVAAFAAAPPADVRLRAGAVAGVAIGALGVVAGVVAGPDWLAVLGGAGFVGGVVLTGVAALRPVRAGLGPARGLITRAYVAALVAVAVGASVATLLLARWQPVASAWSHLKPAHAWLNLFGFVSLVIATTLLHFFPTVVGARIPNHASGRVALAGLGLGPWLVALGYATELGIAVDVGAASAAVGGLALGWYEQRVWRSRARWTGDLAWHAFAIGGLASATAWFVVGLASTVVPAIAAGSDPSGWSIDRVAAPLIGGWVLLALLASATHLLPAVGPGDPASHARQRALLGRIAIPRLALADLGVGLLTVGALLAAPSLVAAGAVALAAGSGATAVLLGLAVWQGVRWTRNRPGQRVA